MKIASVKKSGVGEGFKGYDNGFRGYSTIEGFDGSVDTSGVIIPGNSLADTNLRILDKLKAQNIRINAKIVDMSNNADSIRTKLDKLTGYGGKIHTDDYGSGLAAAKKYTVGTDANDTSKVLKYAGTITPLLKTHDDYDEQNNLIPFIFDDSGVTSDYYKDRTDPKAKIDAIDEDLREMLYQQNTLYTIGSITSATFIITAILLARNNSS